MLANIVMMFVICLILGAVANRIMRGSGGILRNALAGFLGIILAWIAVEIIGFFGPEPGAGFTVILCIVGACVAVPGVRAVRTRIEERRDGDGGDGEGE